MCMLFRTMAEMIDIDFLKYRYHPHDHYDRCDPTHDCTPNSPQSGFNCCPRIEVTHFPGENDCHYVSCSDSTCTQCGEGAKCTDIPPKHTMDLDFNHGISGHMSFDMNLMNHNMFLIMICDCYGMSSERHPIFSQCLNVDVSDDAYHQMKSTPNQYGYAEVALNITRHSDSIVNQLVSTTNGPATNKGESLTQDQGNKSYNPTDSTNPYKTTKAPFKQHRNKDVHFRTNPTGILVTCIAGGLAIGIPVTLLIAKMIN
ncbi:uncharacterized protein [Argopecten irradians]|uniref:uncharacterized protein isoform X1 n=1 Tax=Argopecten irradians TaxID=31199 RepID=UPI0037121D48